MEFNRNTLNQSQNIIEQHLLLKAFLTRLMHSISSSLGSGGSGMMSKGAFGSAAPEVVASPMANLVRRTPLELALAVPCCTIAAATSHAVFFANIGEGGKEGWGAHTCVRVTYMTWHRQHLYVCVTYMT